MADDVEIRSKTGFEMKQEILKILYDEMQRLRESKTLNPFVEYTRNMRIQVLSDMFGRIIDVPPTKNGG